MLRHLREGVSQPDGLNGGVLLVLHLLRLEWWVSGAIIRLENQVAIAVFSLCNPKPVQSIIDRILSQAENVLNGALDSHFIVYLTLF